MARATRVHFPGAWYHVLNRGTERRAIFRSTRCCEKFIECAALATKSECSSPRAATEAAASSEAARGITGLPVRLTICVEFRKVAVERVVVESEMDHAVGSG